MRQRLHQGAHGVDGLDVFHLLLLLSIDFGGETCEQPTRKVPGFEDFNEDDEDVGTARNCNPQKDDDIRKMLF